MPYLGGVAVFVALGCVVATERPSVLLPLGLALVVGVADDVVDLAGRCVRLLGELIVGVCRGRGRSRRVARSERC